MVVNIFINFMNSLVKLMPGIIALVGLIGAIFIVTIPHDANKDVVSVALTVANTAVAGYFGLQRSPSNKEME